MEINVQKGKAGGKRGKFWKKDKPVRIPDVAKRERWILKRLHGCVRKAKQFESGKLMRRVKNAISQQGGHTDIQAKHRETTDLDKLQLQLKAVKGIKADDLATLAGKQCSLSILAATSVELSANGSAPATSPESASQLVAARILASASVRKELQVVKAELAELHQQVARAVAAQQRAAKANNEVADKDLNCPVEVVEADSQHKSRLQDLSQESDVEQGLDPTSSRRAADNDAQLQSSPGQPVNKRRRALEEKKKSGSEGAAASKAGVPNQKKTNRIGSRERRRMKEEASRASRPSCGLPSWSSRNRLIGSLGKKAPPNVAGGVDRSQLAGGVRMAQYRVAAVGIRPLALATSAAKEPVVGLHPSWEAKQRQKLMFAQQPQGKKIVFEE